MKILFFEYKKVYVLRFLISAVLLVTCLGISSFAGAVVFVDSNSSGGNGTSWNKAYRTVEEAIAASGQNQEFWIATGVYTPEQALQPKEGSSFYGGFSGRESSITSRNINNNQTIIDGRQMLKHCFKVLEPNVRIDGLKIQNGLANATSVPVGANYEQYGGGVFVGHLAENTIIVNCTILDCSSITMGGGIFIDRVSVIIRNCLFLDNSSALGGGLAGWEASVNLSFGQFITNRADQGTVGDQENQRGGAIWLNAGTQVISNCTFSDNSAYQGGAIELNNTIDAVISCSTFTGNIAYAVNTDNVLLRKGTGGAIALLWDNVNYAKPSVNIDNCLFDGNTGEFAGGAIYSFYFPVVLYGSRFVNNKAEEGGGVFYDYKLDTPDIIESCFFANNVASNLERRIGVGGAIRSHARSLSIDNSIFVKNRAYNGVGDDNRSGGGAIGFHGGDGVYFNSDFSAIVKNSTFYRNSTDGWGGAINSVYVETTYLYNCILWNNDADQEYYNGNSGEYQASKDIALNGSGAVSIRYSDVETLLWEHGNASYPDDIITGSINVDPLFVDPDGSDDMLGTLDDNFQLSAGSPCIDMADGNNSSQCDYSFSYREDQPASPNTGTGSPSYADIGALERVDNPDTSSCSFVQCSDFPAIVPPSAILEPVHDHTVIMAPVLFLLTREDICPGFDDAVDTDGDSVPDSSDNCPSQLNADQADADGDGVGDVCDNCPYTANSDQSDIDLDGIGDVCDLP